VPKLCHIDNFSRRYYEKELGAGVGPSLSGTEHFGYTEPFRRFVQNELFTPQANEIPNTAPSWLPGDDYYTNFHEGDPFLKVPEGYVRLPGAGYEAVHPEIAGLDPEDYPDIHKMAILADVAPYSREYNTYRQRIGKEAQGNTELEIEYEKILNRVKKTRESVIRMQDRHFTAPVDEIAGTVDEVSPGGITLKEYPGRRFQFSSVSTSAADMSARILGEHQVFPSLRTQKPSRARARPKPHPAGHPCSPLPGSLFLYIRMGKHGSVSSSFRTQKPSRVRDKPRAPSVIPGPLRSWHSPPDHGEQAQVVSPSCRTQKPTRARARPKPDPAGHPCSPLPGSFFLYIRMGKHGSVSSSWRTQKPSRTRDRSPTPRFGIASSPVLRFDQRGLDRMVFPS